MGRGWRQIVRWESFLFGLLLWLLSVILTVVVIVGWVVAVAELKLLLLFRS